MYTRLRSFKNLKKSATFAQLHISSVVFAETENLPLTRTVPKKSKQWRKYPIVLFGFNFIPFCALWRAPAHFQV